jgi:hypothetical protein
MGRAILHKLCREKKIHLETAGEFNHLFGLAVLQTIDTGNTVTNGQDASSLLDINVSSGTEDALLEDRGNLRSLGLGRGVVADSNGGSTKVETSLNGREGKRVIR